MDYDDPEVRTLSDDETMARAREMYCNDDVEIDDAEGDERAALFSAGDRGCWVRAWVWVPYPEVDETEED